MRRKECVYIFLLLGECTRVWMTFEEGCIVNIKYLWWNFLIYTTDVCVGVCEGWWYQVSLFFIEAQNERGKEGCKIQGFVCGNKNELELITEIECINKCGKFSQRITLNLSFFQIHALAIKRHTEAVMFLLAWLKLDDFRINYARILSDFRRQSNAH